MGKTVAGFSEVISVKKVSYRYSKKYLALSDVSFGSQINGGVLSILGPNGSGKTTLVNLMTTSVPLQNGKIEILGYDVSKDSKHLRPRISLCAQTCELDVLLSVKSNLWSYGLVRGMEKNILREKIEHLFDIFGLRDKRNKRVMDLSGGEIRRVQLMRSFLDESAEIIFIDEPTLGLDPIGRKATWNLIKDLAKAGKVFVLTTNDMAEVGMLSKEIIFLYQGKVIAKTTLREWREKYARRVKMSLLELGEREESIVDQWIMANIGKAVCIERGHSLRTIEFSDLGEIPKLLSYIIAGNGTIGKIDIEPETLEDAFINLIRTYGEKNVNS